MKLDFKPLGSDAVSCRSEKYSWIVVRWGGAYQASYKPLDGSTLAHIFIAEDVAIDGKEMVRRASSGDFSATPHLFETEDSAKAACQRMHDLVEGAIVV